MNRRLMKAGEKNYLKESNGTKANCNANVTQVWKSRIYIAVLLTVYLPDIISNFPFLSTIQFFWGKLGEFGIGSTSHPLIDIFLFIPITFLLDIVLIL